MEPTRLPLSGLRVLEMGHTVMGPTCGLILADLGAEVIKVERGPMGDDTRRLKGSGVGFFVYLNRNKKSVVLDLKSAKGKAVLDKLIASADVFIENFGPGAVDRLGFSYDRVCKLNPRLIYCSLKGFLKGPYEHRPALDEVVQMMAGMAYMTGPPGQPLRAGTSVIDIMGGTYGVVGILTALYERERTGKGRFVKAALFESTAFMMGQHMAYAALARQPVKPMPARVRTWSIYDIFLSREGEMIFIGITSDLQWKRFCQTFDLPSLAADERLATNNSRIEEREWLMPQLQDLFRKLEKVEVLRLCEEAGIPFAPVARPEDLFEDPQLNAGAGLVEIPLPGGGKTKLPRIPLQIGSYDFSLRNPAPEMGEGSEDLLKSVGVSGEEIEELKKEGVLVLP